MATGTFTQKFLVKTLNLAYRMLLAQGQICGEKARYCGKMYSRHLFPYGGLKPLQQYFHIVLFIFKYFT